MITSAHKPFNLLIAPAGRPRTKIPELPLIKKENRNNIN
ncbi:hypothetical protein Mgra_00005403 [Meloidogyne graminicola]|uniref:Uncharacterized protein n=1 Tax=Meloidogyne graminicola TaxID=189291 RepID=A0A8S9ZPI9_9BILA|nr:hypothetical protein Mgra_00005403 [Meloidogyne graminicola]